MSIFQAFRNAGNSHSRPRIGCALGAKRFRCSGGSVKPGLEHMGLWNSPPPAFRGVLVPLKTRVTAAPGQRPAHFYTNSARRAAGPPRRHHRPPSGRINAQPRSTAVPPIAGAAGHDPPRATAGAARPPRTAAGPPRAPGPRPAPPSAASPASPATPI